MSDRRKVLFYTHALTGGGCERVLALLASGLARRGHDVLLVTDSSASQNDRFLEPGVRRVVLGGDHGVNVARLAVLLRRERPDVSISALSASNLKLAIAATLAGCLSRAVLSYHGYAVSEPRLLSRIGYISTRFITRITAATVCVSDGLRDYLIERWKADPRKARRIYNPVDVGPLPPASSAADLLARDPIVLGAGRLVAYKGFLRLVRAFAKARPAEARLVILGEGPERPAIEAEIARLGLGDRVVLAGYAEEPWAHYANARCFVLASDSESFGLVIVEALGAGLPIVATDCDGPREILADGVFGTLVARGDEAALARAITATLVAPGEPAARVERARDFSIEHGLDEYEALIEEIASKAHAKRAPDGFLASAKFDSAT